MKTSAGLLVYRKRGQDIEVLLAHMGGPYHARKDAGHWSIPKGEYGEGEDPLTTARREFQEELGIEPPTGELIKLGEIKQNNSKMVTTWAVEADLDVGNITSNTFKMEWPPRSGLTQEFPEIDKAAYFDIQTASEKIIPGQDKLLSLLAEKLSAEPVAAPEQSSLF